MSRRKRKEKGDKLVQPVVDRDGLANPPAKTADPCPCMSACLPPSLAGCHVVGSDVWAVGVMLYALLGGCTPFTGMTHEAIFNKIKRCGPAAHRPAHHTASTTIATELINAPSLGHVKHPASPPFRNTRPLCCCLVTPVRFAAVWCLAVASTA